MHLQGFAAFGLLLIPCALAGDGTSLTPGKNSAPELPFAFAANAGQAAADDLFVGNGPGFRIHFRREGATMYQGAASARLSFLGGEPDPALELQDPLHASVNYLRGAERSGWLRDLPLYQTLLYHGVWAGIDVRFRGEHGRAKAEYLVAAGADVDEIRLRFDGVPSVNRDGSLVVRTSSGEFREEKPYLYQEIHGSRVEVTGEFRVYGDNVVGFTVPNWDHAFPLVVDPTILFSGYFGGSAQTTITAMVVNSFYNTVVAGWTLSAELNATAGAQSTTAGGVDAFVATFGPAGGNLVSCTYLGGSGDDRAFGVAVDGGNNIYVTGWTSSKNFPTLNPFQNKLSGTRDAFVAKLNPNATALLYSSYLGGTGVDWATGIRVNADGTAVVVGNTNSTNLPSTAGGFQRTLRGAQDAFVARLNAAGSAISMLTYFGGTANEFGTSLALDATGGITIAGSTFSSNLPVLNALQAKSGGGQDAFVTRFAASGASLVFSSYLGGAGGSAGAPEQANCVSVSSSGNATVAGTTSSVNFPIVAGAAQSAFAGGLTDGFIVNIGPTGLLRRSTYLGGSGDDGINAMMPDPYGAGPVVGGYTTSTDFPTKNPVQRANAGGMDGFVVRSAYNAVTHGTYIGGSGNDSVNALAVDSLFNFTVAGTTGSADIPVTGTMPAFEGSTLGSFVTRISGSFGLALAATPNFYLDVWHNTGYNGPNTTLVGASFGQAGDIAVAGDWTGSGVKRIGVFRNGVWILDTNGNGILDGTDQNVLFGKAGDMPLTGDWTGDGKIKLGLFRQGTFILDLSGHLTGVATGLSDSTFTFGQVTDVPVAGDWANTGITRVGVFRNGQWIVDYSGTHSSSITYSFGQSGDKPVVGNWGGLGEAIGVYRNGIWILDYDSSRTISSSDMVFSFGGNSYSPLVWQ